MYILTKLDNGITIELKNYQLIVRAENEEARTLLNKLHILDLPFTMGEGHRNFPQELSEDQLVWFLRGQAIDKLEGLEKYRFFQSLIKKIIKEIYS